MKALKINTELPTTFGVNIPSGSILTVLESYVAQQNRREKEYDGKPDWIFPANVNFAVYANEQAYQDKKEPITGLEIGNQIQNLWLRETLYSTIPAEVLIIGAIKEALEEKYPGTIEEIAL